MEATGTPTTIAVSEVEHTSHVAVYLRVFLALLALTVGEYFYAKWFADANFAVLVGGLLLMAGVKAGLVGMYFMHLIFEGRWKYLMLIPTAFLAAIAVLALVPDVGTIREDPGEDVRDLLMQAPADLPPTLLARNP